MGDRVRKALIIDDDPIIRNLMSTLLRRREFATSQAANGEEALALLRRPDAGGPNDEGNFDILLVDLMMPKISGWQVLDYIRRERPDLAGKVIVVSAGGEPLLAGVPPGSFGILLPKPFDAVDFHAAVDRCLGCAETIRNSE